MLFHNRSISRILFRSKANDYHLSCFSVARKIFAVLLFLLELQEDFGTTLHSGKDLAVSLFDFAQSKLPTCIRRNLNLYEDLSIAGYPLLSEEGVSARTSRLTAYGSYPLPSPPLRVAKCPDFPHSSPLQSQSRDNLICCGKERLTVYFSIK